MAAPTLHDLAFLRELQQAGGEQLGVFCRAASSPRARALRFEWATKSKVRHRTVYVLTDKGRDVLAAATTVAP